MGQHRNEYDFMKDGIAKMRLHQEANKKAKLNEELNTSQLSQTEIEDEQNKFKEAIPGTVQFGQFIINPTSRIVEWSGMFPSEKISWNYSLDSSKGCYISADGAQLSDETVDKLQKLKGYYNEWAQYWSNEVS